MTASASQLPRRDTTAIILAGGRGTRMGGKDKGLVDVGGQAMIAHVLAALAPAVSDIIISANRNLDEYAEHGARFKATVCCDEIGEFFGPLAGMLAGMERATTPYVVTAPCDSPLVSGDLVNRLFDTLVRCDGEICTAHDGERAHPVFTLMRSDLATSLRAFLERGGRKIDLWFREHRSVSADLSDRPKWFLNVNREHEREEIENLLRAREHTES